MGILRRLREWREDENGTLIGPNIDADSVDAGSVNTDKETVGAGSNPPELNNDRVDTELIVIPSGGDSTGSLLNLPAGSENRSHLMVGNTSDASNTGLFMMELAGTQAEIHASDKGNGNRPEWLRLFDFQKGVVSESDFVAQNAYALSSMRHTGVLPLYQMETASGSGSVSITNTGLEIREPGNNSDTEESRAYDPITEFDPGDPGRVRIHLSNITIDDNAGARIVLGVVDDDNVQKAYQDFSLDDMLGFVSGAGTFVARNQSNGNTTSSVDSTQDNSWVSNLSWLEIQWSGKTPAQSNSDRFLEVRATDGTTLIEERITDDYPSGENLYLHIGAADVSGSTSRNVDYDVEQIELGTIR